MLVFAMLLLLYVIGISSFVLINAIKNIRIVRRIALDQGFEYRGKWYTVTRIEDLAWNEISKENIEK